MVHLIAEEVSLEFPLYSRAQLYSATDAASADERLRTDSQGNIISMRALDRISIALHSGDRLGIIGSNGAGKTSLLRLFAEILTPTHGALRVSGRSTNLLNINLGMQPGATANRNIILRGLAAGQSIADIKARRDEIIEFAELGDFINMPVETYSSGMRMRLNFAISTAFQPEILILDEWLSAGDLGFREKATERMKEFVAKAGILVMASHNRKLLENNCTRTIWLDRGRIRMDGSIDEVWGAYAEEQKAIREARAREKVALEASPPASLAKQ